MEVIAAYTLDEFCFPPQEELPEHYAFFENLMENRKFAAATTRKKQIAVAWEVAPETITQADLARFFGNCHHSNISRAIEDGGEIGEGGRPSGLTDEQMEAMLQFINDRFAAKNPVLYSELKDYLVQQFSSLVKCSALRQMVARHPELTTISGVPYEAKRLACPPQAIDEHFDVLEAIIISLNIPPELFFNEDEAGYSAWSDKKKSRIVVPINCLDEQGNFAVDRTDKRATLLGCIALDGEALPPLVVITRKTVEYELLYHGYRHFCTLRYTKKGYISKSIYEGWIKDVFIPHVNAKREKFGLQGRWAILIMDGCSCHDSEILKDLLRAEGIHLHLLPAHSSEQTQPLDLGIFGRAKAAQDNVTVPDGTNKMTKKIIKMIDGWRIATTPKNVVAAFRRGGMVLDLGPRAEYVTTINRAYASKVRHYPDVDMPSVGARAKTRMAVGKF